MAKSYEPAYLYKGHTYCGVDAVLAVIKDNNLSHYTSPEGTSTVEEDLDALAALLNVNRAMAKPRFFPRQVTAVPDVRCHKCGDLLA